MKALFLNGSARGDKGITSKLMKAFSDGMSRAGCETLTINISKLKIAPCLACLYCMHENPGICVQKDEMEIIYDELKQSQIVVFGSPIYLDGITAQLKTVIDRMVCSMEPFLQTDKDGFTRHSFSWQIPNELFLISTCGFPESETFTPMIDYFKALSRNMNSRLLAELCIPGSIAIQMKPEILDQKLELIEFAGNEYAKKGIIDEKLIDEINQKLFSTEEYFKLATLYENWCRNKLNEVK